MKMCSMCKEIKSEDNFSPIGTSKKTGERYLASHCKACRVIYNREKYYDGRTSVKAIKTETHRECMCCHKMILFSDARGSYCKTCFKEKYYDPEKAKISTAKYRARNPERWRAAHRVHQFNRKSLIKASSDGSVTDLVLKELLNKVNCCWCGKETLASERTIEHIIELSNGGKHSKDNLDMSCFSCNASRPNKNLKEKQ